MSKITKILFIMIIAIMLFSLCNVVMATGEKEEETTKSSASILVGNLKEKIGTVDKDDDMWTIGGKIITYLKAAGVIVAVAMLTWTGIKFLMASAAEKANYKGTFVPMVVGAICIAAAPFIVDILFNVIQK